MSPIEFTLWAFGFMTVGYLLGYNSKQYEPKPAPRFVVTLNGTYFKGGPFDDEWTSDITRAFHFSTYGLAESTALGVGGRVEEYTP